MLLISIIFCCFLVAVQGGGCPDSHYFNPHQPSPSTVYYPYNITVGFEVYLASNGVNTAVNRPDPNLVVNIDSSYNNWNPVPMTYQDNINGNNGYYTYTFTTAGSYQYTFNVDTNGTTFWYGDCGGNGNLDFTIATCATNQYVSSSTSCGNCPNGTTSTGLEIGVTSCQCPTYQVLDQVSLVCTANMSSVSNLLPSNNQTNPAEITPPSTLQISIEVIKLGVTDSTGQGSGIQCSAQVSSNLTSFSSSWGTITTYQMSYTGDSGTADVYGYNATLAPGLYAYTAYCVDLYDNNYQLSANTDGYVNVTCPSSTPVYNPISGLCVFSLLSCPANNYSADGVTCIGCPVNSTSPGGLGKIEICTCNTGYLLDSANAVCLLNCTQNEYVSGTSCVSCPDGSTSSGGTATGINNCDCGSGSYLYGAGNVCTGSLSYVGGINITGTTALSPYVVTEPGSVFVTIQAYKSGITNNGLSVGIACFLHVWDNGSGNVIGNLPMTFQYLENNNTYFGVNVSESIGVYGVKGYCFDTLLDPTESNQIWSKDSDEFIQFVPFQSTTTTPPTTTSSSEATTTSLAKTTASSTTSSSASKTTTTSSSSSAKTTTSSASKTTTSSSSAKTTTSSSSSSSSSTTSSASASPTSTSTPSPSSTEGYVSVTFRVLNVNFTWYSSSAANAEIFDNAFIDQIAQLLGIDESLIVIISVTQGSVIVNFKVTSTDTSSTQSQINQVLSSSSTPALPVLQSALPNSALENPSAGVTLDSSSSNSHVVNPVNVGAIVGGVIGGVVGVLLIAGLVYFLIKRRSEPDRGLEMK